MDLFTILLIVLVIVLVCAVVLKLGSPWGASGKFGGVSFFGSGSKTVAPTGSCGCSGTSGSLNSTGGKETMLTRLDDERVGDLTYDPIQIAFRPPTTRDLSPGVYDSETTIIGQYDVEEVGEKMLQRQLRKDNINRLRR